MSKNAFGAVMASEKNGPRHSSSRVCFSPDINRQYEGLQAELEEAWTIEQARKSRNSDKPDTTKRLGGKKPRSHEIAEQMGDLIAANPDAFYEVEFEAAERTDWRTLRSQHPPRDKVFADGGLFNSDTFGPAAVRKCMVDPAPDDDVMAYFDKNLSDGEWERLSMTVWALNEGAREVPKSHLASMILDGNANG